MVLVHHLRRGCTRTLRPALVPIVRAPAGGRGLYQSVRVRVCVTKTRFYGDKWTSSGVRTVSQEVVSEADGSAVRSGRFRSPPAGRWGVVGGNSRPEPDPYGPGQMGGTR